VPTFTVTDEAQRDWEKLSAKQRRLLKQAIRKFVEDLKAKRPPRAGLGIEKFESKKGVFEFH
jgi:mRNA-degrading endonuclease RelE of RelBE toxin-antitoxin system